MKRCFALCSTNQLGNLFCRKEDGHDGKHYEYTVADDGRSLDILWSD